MSTGNTENGLVIGIDETIVETMRRNRFGKGKSWIVMDCSDWNQEIPFDVDQRVYILKVRTAEVFESYKINEIYVR